MVTAVESDGSRVRRDVSEPMFVFHRARHSDRPMACRVYAGDECIGVVWRHWDAEHRPVWVTRLTLDGPDLSQEPTKHAAALVLWRIAAVRTEQILEAATA